MSLLELSRWQFALTAAFHMTFPALTVGLSLFLCGVYIAWMRTHNPVYLQIYRFWKRIFAVGFGLGVVAGTVLTFEFGLNWGSYSNAVGPILGVIIGMEVVTAFFLEAGFIGIMLYGDGRVSERVMLFANVMVALGTLLSTTWILAANSWMQTPAGYSLRNGQYEATNWWHAIFNPSFAHRFPHMLVAVLIAAMSLIAGIAAYYLVRHRHPEFARTTFSISLGVLAMLVPLQMYVGDNVAAEMQKYQPTKIQALEGNWTSTNTGWNLIVVPNLNKGTNDFMLTLPKVGSYLGAKDLSGHTPTPGLLQTPANLRPNMWSVFYGFRLMYYPALVMFALAGVGVYLRLRGRLYASRRFQRWVTWMTPFGVVAVIGGWITAETGRQPFVVYGQLLTSGAVSHLASGSLIASLLAFVLVYVALFSIWVGYVVRQVRRGPRPEDLVPVAAAGPPPASTATEPTTPAPRPVRT